MKESSSPQLIDRDLRRFFQRLSPNRQLQRRSYNLLKAILKSLANSTIIGEPISKSDIVKRSRISTQSVYQTIEDWLESSVVKKEGVRKAYRGPSTTVDTYFLTDKGKLLAGIILNDAYLIRNVLKSYVDLIDRVFGRVFIRALIRSLESDIFWREMYDYIKLFSKEKVSNFFEYVVQEKPIYTTLIIFRSSTSITDENKDDESFRVFLDALFEEYTALTLKEERELFIECKTHTHSLYLSRLKKKGRALFRKALQEDPDKLLLPLVCDECNLPFILKYESFDEMALKKGESCINCGRSVESILDSILDKEFS